MTPNTLFLRLEGLLQSWGDQNSKFVIRRTAEAPTKSGVIGLLCAALGVPRSQASEHWLPTLNVLRMGVRIDMPGVRWWDYHTVGAGIEMRTAGKRKEKEKRTDAMPTRREYLCDASFLVALQGEPGVIADLYTALRAPKWTLYLGRKCCPPSRPILESPTGDFPDLLSALTSVPWRRRLNGDRRTEALESLVDWESTPEQPEAPDDALVWYDVPLTFEPPAHLPRFVLRKTFRVGANGEVDVAKDLTQTRTPTPPRPRANYTNTEYRNRRKQRLKSDYGLCVFCKSPAKTVQHTTYRRAGGDESQDDLRSLCRLCHDAVTMIEYGLGMGLDRINPEEPRWRDQIIRKRNDIIKYRSLETRRRRLAAEEVH